jgi:hypothetical protein
MSKVDGVQQPSPSPSEVEPGSSWRKKRRDLEGGKYCEKTDVSLTSREEKENKMTYQRLPIWTCSSSMCSATSV